MKFYKEEVAGNGKTRYLLATNKHEMRILRDITKHYLKNIPKSIETEIMLYKIKNINRALHGIVDEF